MMRPRWTVVCDGDLFNTVREKCELLIETDLCNVRGAMIVAEGESWELVDRSGEQVKGPRTELWSLEGLRAIEQNKHLCSACYAQVQAEGLTLDGIEPDDEDAVKRGRSQRP